MSLRNIDPNFDEDGELSEDDFDDLPPEIQLAMAAGTLNSKQFEMLQKANGLRMHMVSLSQTGDKDSKEMRKTKKEYGKILDEIAEQILNQDTN